MIPCEGCGEPLDAGTVTCQKMFDELLAADFSDYRRARHHRRFIDTYSMQHPAKYCLSARSYAAHLTGLCCAIEHSGDATVNRAVQQWLSGPVEIEKPDLPSDRGVLTVRHVHSIDHIEEYVRCAKA